MKLWAIILVLLCAPSVATAQLVADFSASPTTGCEPFTTQFSDLSSGGGTIVYREWTFGYGGNISNNNNSTPSAAYPVAGSYTVKLVVSDGTDTATIIKPNYIVVRSKPNVQYSISPSGGCAPVLIGFNNNSTAGSGTISSYTWDFGDGTALSSATNPNHTYTTAGTYTPTLQVVNSYGCTNSASLANVNVSGGPVAAFTSTTPQACSPPLTVYFTNTSTGVGPLTYSWQLGNGSNSTAQNPSTTYSSSGYYDVTLVVTDVYGCQTTGFFNDYVIITQVNADFEILSDACVDEPISLANNTVGAGNFVWNWGDNTNGGGSQPTKIYTAGGTYTITLTASSGTCSDTDVETVNVQSINPSFTSTPNYFCEQPYTTTYTNTSTLNFGSIVWHEWYWGIDSPIPGVHSEVSSVTDTFTRDMHQLGYYDDTLIVVSSAGCTAFVANLANVHIDPMFANYSTVPDEGCAPASVQFTDASTPSALYPITLREWDFGNTMSDTGITASTIYNDTGCHYPTLVIENAYGCRDSITPTTVGEALCFGSMPVIGYELSDDSACANLGIWVHDLSTDSNFNNQHFWQFSDGSLYTGPHNIGLFIDTGWLDLQYVVGHHGCKDTVDVDSAVYVKGPIIEFVATHNCNTPLVVQFSTILWKQVQRFYWDFGDGSPIDSVNQFPAHAYPTSGSYIVSLHAINDSNQCQEIQHMTIQVTDVQAVITFENFDITPADSTGCSPMTMQLDGLSSIDYSSIYKWILFGDTATTADSIYFVNYDEPGVYPVGLIIKDIHDCESVTYRNVLITEPEADFDFDFLGSCDPVQVQFTDQSSSQVPVTNWQWSFGDTSSFNFTQSPLHTYGGLGTYLVIQKVTDSIGCSDSRAVQLPVSVPYSSFEVDTTLCELTTAEFNNSSNGTNLSYQWTFGNGATSTQHSPDFIYLDTGWFTVRLIAFDPLGCSDTTFKQVHVQAKPIAFFGADSTESPCLPLTVTFTDSSTSDYLSTWRWTFGDGSVSGTLDTGAAVHIYNQPGIYDVSLTVRTTYGCQSSYTIPALVNVSGPYAEFGIDPDSACKGTPVALYVAERSALGSYRWVFGDGTDTTVQGHVDTIWHEFTQVGYRTPVVVYSDSSGLCDIAFYDTVFVHEVVADFETLPDSVGCAVLNARFVNKSQGANSYAWSASASGNAASASNYFPKPGTYPVVLSIANNEFGCTDKVTKWIVVHPTPVVSAGPDTVLCLGETLQLNATGSASRWQWHKGEYLADSLAQTTAAWPPINTTFTVIATDATGCQGRDSTRVTVQAQPTAQNFSDTSVVIGSTIPLAPIVSDSLLYQWHPVAAFDCPTCSHPSIKPLETGHYKLVFSDVHGCFVDSIEFFVEVIEKYSLDVPEAFTPNGDGVNDVVYLRGWGIKDVLEFSIFNRWGAEVFRSNSMEQGWDGTFKGAPQSMDTYAFQAKVRHYNGEEKSLGGFIELIR